MRLNKIKDSSLFRQFEERPNIESSDTEGPRHRTSVELNVSREDDE